MSLYRQNSNKLKSFSNENLTNEKDREFVLGADIPVRTRSDGEVVKTSDDWQTTDERGFYSNLTESTLIDYMDPSNILRLSTSDIPSESEDVSWVILSEVDSDRELEAATSVQADFEPPRRGEENMKSVSLLEEKLRKIRSDFENDVISSLQKRSRKNTIEDEDSILCSERISDTDGANVRASVSLPNPLTQDENLNLTFLDDHYKENEKKQELFETGMKASVEADSFKSQENGYVYISRSSSDIAKLKKDVVTPNQGLTNNKISLDSDIKPSDLYLYMPTALADASHARNRYLKLTSVAEPDFSLTNSPEHLIVKPVAVHATKSSLESNIAETGISTVAEKSSPEDKIAELGMKKFTTEDEDHSNNSDSTESVQNQSKKFTAMNDEDEIDLIQLSSSSSLDYQSHTPPAKTDGDQTAGIEKSVDHKLSTDSDFVKWTFSNPIKGTTADVKNPQYEKDHEDERVERETKIVDRETKEICVSPSGCDKEKHHLNNATTTTTLSQKSKENAIDSDTWQLLSYDPLLYVEMTSRYPDVTRQLSSREEGKKSDSMTEWVSGTSNPNTTAYERKELSPAGEAYLGSRSSEDGTSLNFINQDLIHFFTHDAVSSSPSSLSRDTNEEADREVADIMGQGSDDYVIEFKSESSSNDWTVSSADDDLVDVSGLELQKCQGVMIQDQLGQFEPSTSPKLLQDHPPEEFPIENAYSDEGEIARLIQHSKMRTHPTLTDSDFLASSTKQEILGEIRSVVHLNEDKPIREPALRGEESRLNQKIGQLNDSTRKLTIDQSIDRHNTGYDINTPSMNNDRVASDDKHQGTPPSKTGPSDESNDIKSPVLKVSSETLLKRLPTVPDFLPSEVQFEHDDISDCTPPMIVGDTGIDLGITWQQSYLEEDIYAKVGCSLY